MSTKTERFEMRMDSMLIDRVDQWREVNGGVSRAEAVRELILHGLDRSNKHGVHFTDGEKLLIAMVADLQKAPAKREIDGSEIMEAIYGGHYWALKWNLSGIFHNHTDSPGALSLVLDTLDMWSFIEEAVETFNSTEREQLEAELGVSGKDPKFFGFDGNNESEYLGIASHLINQMDRFQRFKDRDLNSHMPLVGRYAKMTRVFQPIRSDLGMRHPIRLSVGEVISLLRRDAS